MTIGDERLYIANVDERSPSKSKKCCVFKNVERAQAFCIYMNMMYRPEQQRVMNYQDLLKIKDALQVYSSSYNKIIQNESD